MAVGYRVLAVILAVAAILVARMWVDTPAREKVSA
jgi:hypothetical protein